MSVLICFFCMSLGAQVMNWQYRHITLAALMDTISERTRFKISYDVNAVPVDSVVHVNESDMHPYQLLKTILRNRALHLSLNDNQIVISGSVLKEGSNYVRLRGKVVDAADSVAMPMVNIAIRSRALGTITNMEGDFEFVVPRSFMNDTLSFSFIGYSVCSIPISAGDSLLYVRMRRHDVKLKEVEVRFESTESILEHVLRNKVHNYFNISTVLTGFFRESIKQDNAFVQVSEAIIKIQKPSYQNMFKFERVRFVKGRKLSGLQPMEKINFKLEGGPYQFSRIDIARYQDFLPGDDAELGYKYTYNGVDYLDEQMVYCIGFVPLADDGNLRYKGQLFIHAASYAIVRVDFELTRKSLKNSRKALIKKASRKIKAKLKRARYYTDYRCFNNRWILNKLGGEIVVHIKDKDQKINSEFTGISELLISDCSIKKAARFRASELFKPDYVLADEIQKTDAEFWENYNIIKPGEELEKVFKNQKNENKVAFKKVDGTIK